MGPNQGASSVPHGDCLLLVGSPAVRSRDRACAGLRSSHTDRFVLRLTGNLLRCAVLQQVGRTKRKQVLLFVSTRRDTRWLRKEDI